MAGYIYCFTNPLMINLCKCGGTENLPEIRCKQLFTTALPVPCTVEFYIKVKDWRKAEKEIHNKIKEIGIKRFENREWFNCQPKDIKNIYDNYYDKIDITDSTIKYSENSTISNKYENIIINKKYKDGNNYNCEKCNYTTVKKYDFQRHLDTKKHIENTKKQYRCDNCDTCYDIRQSYYYHKKKCDQNNMDSQIQLLMTKHKIEQIKKDIEIEKMKNQYEKKHHQLLKDMVKKSIKTRNDVLKITSELEDIL